MPLCGKQTHLLVKEVRGRVCLQKSNVYITHSQVSGQVPVELLNKAAILAGVSNLPPYGSRQPRMAVNASRNKIINLLKTS